MGYTVIQHPRRGLRWASLRAPLVDFVAVERGSVLVTIVPHETVSRAEKETIELSSASPEGKRIRKALTELSKISLKAGKLRRVSHAGGSLFTFLGAANRVVELEQMPEKSQVSALVLLSDIAQAAEIALRLRQQGRAA